MNEYEKAFQDLRIDNQLKEIKNEIKVDPWIHRSEGMRCRTCIWYVPKVLTAKLGETTVGRCRRHAPTMGGYPVVYQTDWCGDHRIDENKI